VIVSDEFDETHVRQLTSCSLEECLCHSETGLSSRQPCMGTETTDVSSAQSPRQDRGVGDKDDIVMGNHDKRVGGKRQLVTTAVLLDSITHPDVIALICQKLTDKLDMTWIIPLTEHITSIMATIRYRDKKMFYAYYSYSLGERSLL